MGNGEKAFDALSQISLLGGFLSYQMPFIATLNKKISWDKAQDISPFPLVSCKARIETV